jgi:hypothetical protein
MPFGFPRCEKVAALRSAHLFAKVNFFSFRVGVLKKNTDTEVARTLLLQKTVASVSFPVLDKISNKTGQ